MNNDEIQKFLNGAGPKVKHALDNLSITPEQARHASVMGQIGGASGSLVGAALGAGIGAAVHHPGAGAGIGAMAGGALGGGGGSALGVYSGRAKGPKKVKTTVAKPRATKTVSKSFTNPSEDAKHKLAQGGLGVAAVADAAGASAAWKETKNAALPALKGMNAAKKIRTVAGYAKEKAAFPIVAGGIGATLLAEHVMHETKPKTPKGTPVMKSADEVFAKARGQYNEGKHKRGGDGRFAAVTGASLLGSGTMAAHLSDGARHIGQELELHGRRVKNEADGVTAGGQTAQHAAKEHNEYFRHEPNGDRLAQTLKNSGAHQLDRGKRLGYLGDDAVKAGAELSHAGRIGTKVGVGAAAAGLGLGAYGAYRQAKSRKEGLKKNDTLSSDVEAIFAKAREVEKALEPETRKGMKVGGGIGAGIGAVSGTALGGPSLGVRAAAIDGAVGAGIGGMIGAHKANKRIRKPAQPEVVGKSWATLATEGQKAVGMARGVGGFHAANAVRAVTPAAENVVATARKVTTKVNALPKPVKVGAAAGAGVGAVGGAAFGASRKKD